MRAEDSRLHNSHPISCTEVIEAASLLHCKAAMRCGSQLQCHIKEWLRSQGPKRPP
jgi:hypothetical protein